MAKPEAIGSMYSLFERYSRLRYIFRGHKFWGNGYYVSTVGLDETRIRRYIQEQEEDDQIEDSQELPEESNPFEGKE